MVCGACDHSYLNWEVEVIQEAEVWLGLRGLYNSIGEIQGPLASQGMVLAHHSVCRSCNPQDIQVRDAKSFTVQAPIAHLYSTFSMYLNVASEPGSLQMPCSHRMA